MQNFSPGRFTYSKTNRSSFNTKLTQVLASLVCNDEPLTGGLYTVIVLEIGITRTMRLHALVTVATVGAVNTVTAAAAYLRREIGLTSLNNGNNKIYI